MGKGSSSGSMRRQYESEVRQMEREAQLRQESYASQLASQGGDITPAIAKSIAQDADSAQAMQLADRQRMRGISSTYLRGVTTSSGGKSKLGQ